MLIQYSPNFWKEFETLSKENSKLAVKLMELLRDIEQNPFTGKGKPEALKGNLQGCWSRRINDKHRLIYRISDIDILNKKHTIASIISCYGHYGDK